MALSDYEPIFQSAAKEWNVDPTLLKAVATQESRGKPGAVSRAGAQGLMQITPETQKYLGVTDPNDPQQSIYGAAKYLSEGLDKEGTPEGALLYYHGGPAWRDKYGPESKAYVPGVIGHYKTLSAPTKQAAAAPSHSEMSDDDFLKSTGGGSSAPTQEEDAVFLARTGGKAAPVPAPNPDAGMNEYGITEDPQQFNKQPAHDIGTPVANTASAALEGAKAGFGTAPLGMSPQTDQALVNAGVFNGPNEYNPLKGINRAIVGGGAALGDLALRGGSALVGAYQRGVAQAGEEAGMPQLGRDLAALPEAFPTGDVRGGTLLPMSSRAAPANPLEREISPAAHDALDAPLSAGFRDNPGVTTSSLPSGAAMDNPLVPARSAALAAPEAIGPRSVGAAASSSSETGISAAQERAYRSTAEGQKLLEPQAIGTEDRNQYVHGSNPNAAEIEQQVNTARELKSLNMKAPEVSQEFKEIAAANNEARAKHFEQTAGSDVDVLNADEKRSAQGAADRTKAWADKKPADAQPVIEMAEKIKTSPEGRRPLVRNAVDAVTKELFDKDGNLETDPEQLYGVRKHIDDLMSEEAGVDDPKSVRAIENLRLLKETLDGVIEKAAPGFKEYRTNFANASKRIDEMKVLQKHEPKLYDDKNRMTYHKVQTMMRQIVDRRQAPGINPYKSITDDTMQRLWALRDDLRRSASAQELASTPGGSDSAQNFMDIMKGVGKSSADMAVHGAIIAHTGPAGNLLYSAAKHALSNKLVARSAKKQSERGMELLRPKTELHNPLASP